MAELSGTGQKLELQQALNLSPIGAGLALVYVLALAHLRSSCEDRIGAGPPRARTEVIYVDLGYFGLDPPKTVLTLQYVDPSFRVLSGRL